MNLDEWRDALIADGWDVEAIRGEYRPDVSLRFKRDVWQIELYRRCDSMAQDIMCWGPDRLALKLPESYNFAQMEDNLLLCGRCGEYVEEITRLGFSERVCRLCWGLYLAEVEYPGWAG